MLPKSQTINLEGLLTAIFKDTYPLDLRTVKSSSVEVFGPSIFKAVEYIFDRIQMDMVEFFLLQINISLSVSIAISDCYLVNISAAIVSSREC